jgi:hypothetical protein
MGTHKPYTLDELLEEYTRKGYASWPRMVESVKALDEALAALRKAEQGVAEILNDTVPKSAQRTLPGVRVNLDEAAGVIGVARRTIERWEKEGKVTLIREGRSVFMEAEEFDRARAWRKVLP